MAKNETPMPPFKHQTKTQALSNHLIQMARELGPEARLPTMQQLCDTLQVSVVTLNRALSELEAQNIISRKHGVGIFVSPTLNQKTIGLVYDRDIFQAGSSPFCGLLVEGARSRADAGGEKFSFYLAVPSKAGLPVHEDLVDDLQARRLNGLLFIGEQNPQAAQWLLEQDVPLVALAYTPLAPWRVHIDWPEVVRLGVLRLAEQGCKNIGLWIPVGVGFGRVGDAASFPELDAFEAALAEKKLDYNPELVWQNDKLSDQATGFEDVTNQEQGFRAAFETFGSGNGKSRSTPDGLVILDDMMTRGAMVAMQQSGVAVGTDVKIASHINRGSTVLAAYEDQLSLIEIDPQEIIQAMYDMLETLMAGKTPRKRTVAIKPALKK